VVGRVAEAVLAAQAVQVVEAVEVVRVAEVVQAVEVDLQVVEAARVEQVVAQEVDPLAVKTAKVAARKQGTPLEVPKRARKSERSLQKLTESDSAYQFTCQAG